MSGFSSMVQGLLAKMQQKQGNQFQGIGAKGPQYNPGPTREFTPGPTPDVPFMPRAMVGPQPIALGGGQPQIPGMVPGGSMANLGLGGGNPNNVPGASMMPYGQTANYNQTPGTHAGAAAPSSGMRAFNPAMAQSAIALLQRARSAPQPWVNMPVSRWGGQG